MISFSQKRRRAISLRMSAMGKKSQSVQRERREAAITQEDIMDMRANPALCPGDAMGSIEVRNFRSGAVARWTVLRGRRVNNYRLRTPDGRTSKDHGMAWIATKLRPVILKTI
jgi:hypothetical protein